MHGDLPVSSKHVAKMRADPFGQLLSIRLLEVKRGYSRVEMKVRPGMANFHGLAHGGAVFALADTAFAAASNSHGQRALALTVEIAYRHPAFPGDRLVAEALEESLGKSTALYHITVRGRAGKIVASCHGTVFRTGESVLDPIKRRIR